MFLEKFAEGPLVREVEHLGNLADRQAVVFEQGHGLVGNFVADDGVWGFPHHLLDNSAEVFGRDAEGIGIELDVVLLGKVFRHEGHEVERDEIAFAHIRRYVAVALLMGEHAVTQFEAETFEVDTGQFTAVVVGRVGQRFVQEAQCQRAGITTEKVLSVLSGYFGSIYASNFNRFTKLYRVIIQAPSDSRKSIQSLDNIFVKTSDGMAPVSQFVTLTKTYGAESLTRFNMFSSINVQGMPASGYSSGDVINAVKEVAAQTLPTGYGYEFSGMTREEEQMAESHDTVIIYGICILFIYLILCALYESLFIPMAVILSVPFGLMGSFLFARLWGIENNIYLQTGLIMLIGLLPLMFASGVGANGNTSLGVGTVGGMLIGTVALCL